MPRKIRELKADVRRIGLVRRRKRGKGSHAWWEHPTIPGIAVNLSGADGDDAQPYQEEAVQEAIRKVKEATLP